MATITGGLVYTVFFHLGNLFREVGSSIQVVPKTSSVLATCFLAQLAIQLFFSTRLLSHICNLIIIIEIHIITFSIEIFTCTYYVHYFAFNKIISMSLCIAFQCTETYALSTYCTSAVDQ